MTCSITGCDRPAHSKGMCKAHYERQRTKKDPGPASVRARASVRNPVCTVGGCEAPHKAHGLCSTHYSRMVDTGAVDAGRPVRQKNRVGCLVPNCDAKHYGRGLCKAHLWQSTTFNLSVEHVAALPTACEVCGSVENLRVDHDHKCCAGRGSCGKCVRGVLCHSCNIALGMMKDSPELLRKLADYMEKK